MRKSAEERKEEIKAYYWRNRETILGKARKLAEETKRRREERLQREKNTTELEFYQRWQKQLSERLKDDDLDDWLVTALQLLSKQINGIINILNNGNKERTKTDKED
jgi:hypothetical protein